MKKLLILFTLLATVSLSAQITEKDLLGSWKLTTVEMEGIILNVETNTVKAADPTKENDPGVLYMKEMIQNGMGEELKAVRMVFKPNSEVEMIEDGEGETVTYTLTAKAPQVLHVNLEEPVEFEISLAEGTLKFIALGESGAMYFTKTK